MLLVLRRVYQFRSKELVLARKEVLHRLLFLRIVHELKQNRCSVDRSFLGKFCFGQEDNLVRLDPNHHIFLLHIRCLECKFLQYLLLVQQLIEKEVGLYDK